VVFPFLSLTMGDIILLFIYKNILIIQLLEK
jgi:hypothetical protein